MPSSTKWRLYITATNSSYANLGTLAMYDATGTDLCTGGTATASSVYGGQTANLAFDGNTATYWESGGGLTGTPAWLQYEFASAVSPTHYSIQSGAYGNEDPITFKLQYYDGSAWQDADTQTGTAGWSATTEVRTYPLAAGYGWRLYVTDRNGAGSTYLEFAELQFRTASGGANQATDVTRFVGDTYAGLPLANLIDGNAATDWTSNNNAYPHWIQYVFPTVTTVAEYVIKASASVSASYSPKDFKLQQWNGSAWADVDTRTGETGWTASEVRTYSAVTTVSGAGTAAGTATVTGVGQLGLVAVGSAAGLATVSGVGITAIRGSLATVGVG
jgi:hypothetical protein